jgi:hypothetical protein
MSETLFQINVPDEKLTTLHAKLELATFPDELEDAEWKYGAPLADIKRLAEHWKNGYDWRKHERELNQELPMFTRDIEVDEFGALNIHYVHKKSEVVDAIPLLFCHGCRSCSTLATTDMSLSFTRAWKFPGSQKGPASLDCLVPRTPQLPCCSH